MGKHVHAEVIKAWAEGAEVQVFRHEYDGYYWEDTATPSFNTDFEYRVKPADKIAEKEPIGFMDFGDPKNWKEFKNNTWDNSIKGEKHMKDDWNPPAWLAPNNRYITVGYGYQFVVMADNARDSKWTPLYPKREWVGLTDEEKRIIKSFVKYNKFITVAEYVENVQDATEAKLKEKNT